MTSEDTKGKKRKGAPESAPKAKKPRKSDDVAAASKPTKAPKPTAAKPASKKTSRKEAADFFSDNDAPAVEPAQGEVKSTKAKKKSKKEGKAPDADIEEAPVVKAPTEKTKSKKAKTAPVEADAVVEAQVETAVKKAKKAKSNKKQAEPEEQDVEAEVAVTEVEEADDVDDDQTAALLAGFESDDEENDPEDDEDFEENAVVPKLSKKQLTALEKATKGARSNEPGVVYVGRVPRGFFESQMKKYFSQFGKVNRLRLSRNKKTGASKHYAFVEFASTEVADIVARTMDNYLLFGHILKCKLVPADQVHPDLFKGAGSRFKVEPRNKKAGLQMERGVERAQWEKRVETENKRRSGRNKALQEEFGYTYTVPIVKSVDSVPKQLENGAPQQLVDAPVEEQPKPKKSKKVAKITEEQPGESAQPAAEKRAKKATKAKIAIEADVQAEIAAEIADVVPEKKSRKDKKRTSDVVLESTAAVEEVVTPESATKTKKAKKEGKSAVDEESAAGKKRAAKADQEVTKPKKAKKAKA